MRRALVSECLLLFSFTVGPALAQKEEQRPVLRGPLSLDEAVNTALRLNPLVRGQSAEVEAARARLRQVIAETRLSGSTTSFLTTGDGANMVVAPASIMPMDMEMMGPRTTFNQNLSVRFPLYTGGRLKMGVRAERATLRSKEADKETVRQQTILETRVAYRRVVWNREVVDIYRAEVEAAQERLRVDRAMYEVGKVPLVNVLRNEAYLAEAQQKLANAQRDLDIALTDLKTVIGVDQKSDFQLVDKLAPSPMAADEDSLLARAFLSRPELRATAQRVAAAESAVRVAAAAFKPQVDAIGMADWFRQRGADAEAGVTIGIVAGLPVFDGGYRRAKVEEARSELKKVQEEHEQIKLMVAQQVRIAVLQLQTATQNIATAQTALKAAEEDYRLAQLRYASGKGINLEPLDALAALTRARTNLAQAIFEQNVAVDTLERVVGIPLREEK